ncbi:MAG: hypothetical protein JWM14_933 [Chitinophagaceae bacterium]|nr:hypothetical protein [Chitinophagaceae bacterium]
MRKLSYYLSVAVLATTVVLSSCKKSDDPTPDNLTPDVSLTMNQTNGTGTANQNLTVKNTQGSAVLEVTAITTTSNDMKRLYVYKTEDGGTTTNIGLDGFKQDGNNNYYYDIPNDSRNNFTIKRRVNVSSNTNRITDLYQFYFTKANDFNVLSPGSNVIIGPGTITLIYDVDLSTSKADQKLYNICSSQFPSAYNLQTLSGVSATAAQGTGIITVGSGADFAQQTGIAACGTFNGWVGQNGTTFVKAGSSFDYSNATRNLATTTYTSGTAVSTVTGVSVGDIYVANVRGAGNYAVIRITAVNSTTSDNDDNYVFDVKK